MNKLLTIIVLLIVVSFIALQVANIWQTQMNLRLWEAQVQFDQSVSTKLQTV